MSHDSLATILESEDLQFGHGKGTRHERILGGPLNLSLRKGELVCLLGPNGAGKSTLLRSLCGFLPPLSGSVQMNGKPIEKYLPRELARIRGVLPTREFPPGGMLAEELVSLGRHPHSNWTGKLSPADQQAVHNAFEETGSERFRQRPVGELSDGERQRVSLARLLAQEPALAFLDEPAAFLDLPSRIEILGKLSSIAHSRNIAILLTTHDLESALRHADRIWLLGSEGRWAEGAPEDLVLRGAFEETFASEALTFDINHGSFHPKTKPGTAIQLIGPDPQRLWTARALQRNGWSATHDAGTELGIEIVQDGSAFRWILRSTKENSETLGSIEECLQAIHRIDAKRSSPSVETTR